MELVPVDHDPFAAGGSQNASPQLVPVDFDPFAKTTAPHAVQPGNPLGYSPRGKATPIQSQDVDNIVRSIAGGVPFMDRIAAAGGALTGLGGDFGDYAGNLERERARDEAYRQSNPVASTAGNVLGGVASSIATVPASLYAGGAGLLGRIGAGAATGAGLGAIQGASDAPDWMNLSETAQRMKSGALTGGAFGAAVPIAGSMLSRLITPLPSTPQRAANVNVLRREGVPLTAGQVTGNKPLQWAESTLSDIPLAGGGAGNVQQAQREAFTRAALRRADINAPRATPDIMAAGRDALGRQFEDIASRNTLRLDPGFNQELHTALTQYESLVPPSSRAPGVNRIADDLTTAMVAGGQIPGDAYQAMRSRLTKQAQGLRMSDPQQAEAYRSIREALDNAMNRSIAQTNPADAGLWAQIRRNYGNYKSVEKAAGAAGEAAAEGAISPAQLRSAIASGNNRGGYVRGEGDLAELARAGVNVMTPLPQSGTAPRSMIQGALMGTGAMAGGIPGLVAGIAGPAVAGRVLMSPPVQSYLGNQLMPRLGTIGPAYNDVARALGGAERATRKKRKRRDETN